MAALTGFMTSERIIRHAHVFCGIGAGAKGFNMSKARVGPVSAKFVCTGGIDVDPGAIRNFERLTGCPGTVMDLFDRPQYTAFHGREPPIGWREATPADVRAALVGPDGVRPDVIFLSAPCKGFSGLLSSKQSATDKYQALNGLTLRGVWLICEAFKDGPIPVILFENVPRILTRGRPLLDQIAAILRGYSYNVAETVHDCGELGGLAQSRKRMLLIARQREIIPNFIYEPEKKRLRGVGEVIGKLPMPGDPVAGVMHRMPLLQWKTWLRLALVPAGRDWRALNELEVVDGVLRDFGIIPEQEYRDGVLGVLGWNETAGTVIGNQRSPLHGRHSVADPRIETDREGTGRLGVRDWAEPTGTVTSGSRPENGAYSVADPRVDGHPKSVQLGVRSWGKPSACVKGDVSVGTGPYAVADPRHHGRPKFNNIFRIVPFDGAAPAVAGPGGTAGGACVADPRMGEKDYTTTKYKITPWGGQSRAVIGASTTGDGAYAVADPRGGEDPTKLFGNRHVDRWEAPARAVIGNAKNGASAVADPRPVCLNANGREGYATQGHYGVVDWAEPSNAIPAFAKNNNGRWSVADPRAWPPAPLDQLPAPEDRLDACIIALDGTRHRPFTTLDLTALQSIVDPEEVFYRDADGVWHARMPFELESKSDSEKREWIGNAVPSESAAEIGSVIGEAILLADVGETFALSSNAIWVSPVRVALAVEQNQAALQWEARA
jgi:site-specific DNA-cytosine methylase